MVHLGIHFARKSLNQTLVSGLAKPEKRLPLHDENGDILEHGLRTRKVGRDGPHTEAVDSS